MNQLGGMDLIELFIEELKLCDVKEGETVVILAEPSSRQDFVGAAFGAAQMLGALVMQVTVPGGSTVQLPSSRTGSGAGLQSVADNPLARSVLENASMVIDVTTEGFIHTPLIGDILQAGTRVLFIADPPEVLARHLPTPDDKRRALVAVELMKQSSTLRVTSSAGTDLSADLVDSHPGYQCGYADDAGRWDHWPSTMVLCWPRTSNGTIVLQAGDVVLPFKDFVREEVTLEIIDGRIQDIRGGADAKLLRLFLDDSDDHEARFLSHMGWGLMKGADWFALPLYDKENIMGMDARSFAGNFLFSTGPHPFLGRTTPYHLDIPMRGCTVALDGREVVRDGLLVEAVTDA